MTKEVFFMEKFNNFFMKIGRWVVMGICVLAYFTKDTYLPTLTEDMDTLVTAAIALPFILCILTIKPENLKKK